MQLHFRFKDINVVSQSGFFQIQSRVVKPEPKPLDNPVIIMNYAAYASMSFLQVLQALKESVNVFVSVLAL